MTTAIDTNILLDIWQRKEVQTLQALARCAGQGKLCICAVVYAETGSRFASKKELDTFLFDIGVELQSFTTEAAFRAGQLFRDYLRHGGSRQRVTPDFLIGAHAMLQASCLLTRDRGFYRQYFRGLKLIEP